MENVEEVNASWLVELEFWKSLALAIEEEYPVLKWQCFSKEAIVGFSDNTNEEYGLPFLVGSYQDADLCIFITKQNGFLAFGVTMSVFGERSISNHYRFSALANRISPFCDWAKKPNWLGGKYLVPMTSFHSDGDVNALLGSEKQRKGYIAENLNQINTFVQNVLNVL